METLVGRAIALLGVAILVALAARRLRLPYTVGLVLTGLGLAFARVDYGIALTHDVIFDLILPPLLFEAALNLRWRALKADLVPVLAMACLGVALGAGVVAIGLVFALNWPVAPALAFGALIAATDPIAVIALLRETGVRGRLALIIEAEALINDGVAALLFALVLMALVSGAAPGPVDVAAHLALIAVGGLAIGLATGGAAILFAGRVEDHLVETALTVVAAYGSFLIAEHVGASGVLACVAAGMLMGNVGEVGDGKAKSPLSARGRAFVVAFWEFAAFLANSFVFLLIGVALAHVEARAPARLALIILLALIGRAAAVYPIALALAPTRWRIPAAEQHFLWWAGLRGALALALALALPLSAPYRNEILVAAFAVVAFSSLVQGLTAGLALKALGLRR